MCSSATTLRIASSDCSLVGARPPPRTLRATAIAAGSRVATTSGAGTESPPAGPRRKKQLLDLPAGFAIARAGVVDFAPRDEDARRRRRLASELLAGESDRLPRPGPMVDPLAREQQQRGGGHEQDQFEHRINRMSTDEWRRRRSRRRASSPLRRQPMARPLEGSVGTPGDAGRLYSSSSQISHVASGFGGSHGVFSHSSAECDGAQFRSACGENYSRRESIPRVQRPFDGSHLFDACISVELSEQRLLDGVPARRRVRRAGSRRGGRRDGRTPASPTCPSPRRRTSGG